VDELQSQAVAFFISAIAMGIVCSMLGFKEPIKATFITTAPAPVICLLAYIGINRALAAFPDVTPIVSFFLIAIFSTLYGVLAVFGCVIGIRLRTLIENLIHETEAIKGGDPILAAKIATAGTLATGLLALFGAVLSAYIK
jgi:hypothetical protein